MTDSTTAVRHGIYYSGPATTADVVANPSGFHTMYVDGTEFTPDDVRDLKADATALEEHNTRLREANRAANANLSALQAAVRSAFTELVEDGDLEKATANAALEELGLDPLPTKYRATVTVEFEVTCESTEGMDAVENALRDSDFTMNNYSSELDDYDVGSTNVDDVQVEEDE